MRPILSPAVRNHSNGPTWAHGPCFWSLRMPTSCAITICRLCTVGHSLRRRQGYRCDRRIDRSGSVLDLRPRSVPEDRGVESVAPLLYVAGYRNYQRIRSRPGRVRGQIVRVRPVEGIAGRVSTKVAAAGEGPAGGTGCRDFRVLARCGTGKMESSSAAVIPASVWRRSRKQVTGSRASSSSPPPRCGRRTRRRSRPRWGWQDGG